MALTRVVTLLRPLVALVVAGVWCFGFWAPTFAEPVPGLPVGLPDVPTRDGERPAEPVPDVPEPGQPERGEEGELPRREATKLAKAPAPRRPPAAGRPTRTPGSPSAPGGLGLPTFGLERAANTLRSPARRVHAAHQRFLI